VAGIGSGLFIAPNAQFIVATVDRAEAGAASGVVGTMQRVGSAIGIAVIGSVYFGNLPNKFGPTQKQAADAAQAHGAEGAAAIKAAIQKIVDHNLAVGFGHSATLALAVSAIFAIAAFVLVFALPKRISRGYEAPASAPAEAPAGAPADALADAPAGAPADNTGASRR
jgi:hypothetical protein